MTNEVLVNASRDYQWRGSGDKHTDYAGRSGTAESVPGGELAQLHRLSGLRHVPVRHGRPVLAGDATSDCSRTTRPRSTANTNSSSASTSGRDDRQIREFHGRIVSTPAPWPPRCTIRLRRLRVRWRAADRIRLANFELGVLNYNASFKRRWFHFRRQEFAPYFQDNWKVTRRLTLNLGLRYEMRSPLYDKDGTLLSFDFAKHALVTGTERGQLCQAG